MAFPLVANPTAVWNGKSLDLNNLQSIDRNSISGPAVRMVNLASQYSSTVPFTQGPTRAVFVDQTGVITGHDAYGNAVVIGVPAGLSFVVLAGITSVATITSLFGVW